MEVMVLGRRCALGEDCPECDLLRARVYTVLSQLGVSGVEVKYPKDLDEFLSYGVVATPALALNETIRIMGRVPREASLRRLFQDELAQEQAVLAGAARDQGGTSVEQS